MSCILAQVSVRVRVKDGRDQGCGEGAEMRWEDTQAVVWLPVDPEAELLKQEAKCPVKTLTTDGATSHRPASSRNITIKCFNRG